MAFWIKKQNGESESPASETSKKKDEKKVIAAKRIDNLRISRQLKVTLKSIGTPNEFVFVTKDLSSTGAFVICKNLRRYPFQPISTILEAEVELKSTDDISHIPIRFLCKIARVVESDALDLAVIPGFGIHIIQMPHEQRLIFEKYIATHGSPDPLASDSNSTLEQEESEEFLESQIHVSHAG